jgi:tRNA 5-methylaminomethyl-2-thiouridine biosynthesis bifunctional protein
MPSFKKPQGSTTTARPWLHRSPQNYPEKKACVIGAGIAGASIAHRLALRGWQVTVLEAATLASGASGNPAAIIYPQLSTTPDLHDSFSQQAWRFALSDLSALPNANKLWHSCGVLQLLAGNQQRLLGKSLAAISDSGAYLLDPEKASEKAGVRIEHEALWHPHAGWVDAAAYCHYLLSWPGITLRENSAVDHIDHASSKWRLWSNNDVVLHESPVVIIANSVAAKHFSQTSKLPLHAVRGQVSCMPPTAGSSALKTILCHDGYLTPILPNGQHCLGATFHSDENDTDIRLAEHLENHDLLKKFLPELASQSAPIESWQGRASIRCQSPDYLPLLGPIADYDNFRECYAGLRDGKLLNYPVLPTLTGLYVSLGYGSKGFSQAGFAAEILAAEINGEAAVGSEKMRETLHPMRFWAKQLKRNN